MHLHVGTFEGKRAFLFLDKEERIVDLPTRFFRSLANSSRKLAPSTLNRYSVKICGLCNFLEADPVYGQFRIDDALACLKRPALQRFYSSLQDAGQEAATVRLAEAAVRSFTNWLNSDEAGYIHERNIYPEVGGALTPAPSKRQPRYLTEFEVIQLINAQRYEAQRLVVHFMYDTGVRISEVERVLAIDLPDWRHYPEGQMYFPLFVRGSKGRGGDIKQRYTLISRPVLSRLARYHNSKEYLFNFAFEENEKPAMLNVYGDPWTVDAIEALIERGRIRAKLKKASAHRLRHGTAFSLLKSDHGKTMLDNLVIAQKALGHSKLETTEGYTNIPAPVLQQLRINFGQPEFTSRFEEAQKIFDATFLPAKREPEKRRIGVTQ